VTGLLAPGGRLAGRWPRYEERAGQRALAEQIAETLERGGVLLAEAPTGLGKSLAYLLPSVLIALERNQRVVVATCTRSLQDQLYERDLPALLAALDAPLRAVRLKGKQNYLCPRLLELAEERGPEEKDVLDRLRRWSDEDPEGDLDRFESPDPEAFRRIRARVCADPNACTAASCRRGRECFWVRARRQAAQAPLLVVNHALLALSGGVDGLLPEFDVLIVDEAHRLEGVLLSQLERSVSQNRFEEALRLVASGRGAARGGLASRLRAFALPLLREGGNPEALKDELERLTRRVAECREAAGDLFAGIEPRGPAHPVYGTRERYHSASQLFGSDLRPLERVLDHCAQFARALHRVADSLEGMRSSPVAEELASEFEQVSARWAGLGSDLERLGDASERGWVYWRTAGGRGVELHGAPVTVGEHARRLVLTRGRAAVLTSATLSAGGDFTFLAERLGLGEQWGVPYEAGTHPSPFALERQMRAFVYDGGADEASVVAELVAELALATGRNQLVLFTAHERLRRARERLLTRLGPEASLFAQEWDGPASLLAERFRRERGAILLGVQSLWEGVDFPGEALEIVVMAKLPFSVPDDPLVEARGERLRDRGLDPFQHDAVPEAVLRFRQGAGRLIRRADDRGVLVICDPRLLTASYRRPFLESLPVRPVLCKNARELAVEAARFLSGEVPVEDET
jgi:Rad3-related DNA helicase